MNRLVGALVVSGLSLSVAWGASLEQGLAAFKAGRFEAATAVFTAVLQDAPGELAARYWRARSYAAQGKLPAAIADFEAVLRVKPDSVPSREGLAAAKAQLAAQSASQLSAVAAPPERAVQAPAARLGPHLAIATDLPAELAAALTRSGVEASGPQLLDYTFGSAPTDWEPTSGVWQVSSRFACDPSWSFFGGYGQGLAAIWNKRRFEGDTVVEAYVSFKHGLPWNPVSWSYRPADLCLTLCGDGRNPDSGYSFIYAGDEGSRTMIRKGAKVLAETTDPQFLSPSYSDVRPATEDFHRRWWQLVAQRRGRTLTFLVDGRKALEVEDPEPLAGGRVALWTVRNGMMVARVRIAYQQELRALDPLVVDREPPAGSERPAVALAR